MSDDTEDLSEVIRRCVARQPEIYLSGHEGYYRHSDIAVLLRNVRPKRLITKESS